MCPASRAMCEQEREGNLKKIKVPQVELDHTCAGMHKPPGYGFSAQLTWVAEPQIQKNVTNFQ